MLGAFGCQQSKLSLEIQADLTLLCSLDIWSYSLCRAGHLGLFRNRINILLVLYTWVLFEWLGSYRTVLYMPLLWYKAIQLTTKERVLNHSPDCRAILVLTTVAQPTRSNLRCLLTSGCISTVSFSPSVTIDPRYNTPSASHYTYFSYTT